METKGFIEGFSSREIRVSFSAFAQANDYLQSNNINDEANRIKKLELLIEGYESPLGMELLSSVHFLATNECKSLVEDIIHAIQSWTDQKATKFGQEKIEKAHQRLVEDDLISP